MKSARKISGRSISYVALGTAVVIFTGCATVGPNYIAPKTPVSNNWHTQLRGGLTAQEMDPQTLSSWWTKLNDPVLSGLIERAVSGNLDLKKGRARIREARALRGIAAAGRFPTLDASGAVTRTRTSENTGYGQTDTLYFAGFDAAWELDLFGGVRRSVEAAEANRGAVQEDLRDVLVSLLAEVTLNYLEVRTYQARIKVAAGNLAVQTETHRLAAWRFEAGLSDQLGVEQALYNVENTRSQIPTLRMGAEQAMNRMAVLLGEEPGMLQAELARYSPIPATPLQIAVGVPADLLRRRPDVRRAERELAAQTARIGVATAELYPKFTLNGSIGLEAFSLNNLVSAGSRFFSAGPSITWRIFDAGAIRQNIEVQSALQEQYLVAYESAVLNALKDVENALVAYREEQNRRQSLTESTLAAQRAVNLAQQKYQAGLSDFTSVLDAQRSLLSFQDQFAQSDGTVVSNLVRLYKALGGGWAFFAQNGTK